MNSTTDISTLLVIDVQGAVVDGSADVPGVISRINELLERARKSGTRIIFIQHEEEGEEELTAGSAGWQMVADLDYRSGDTVVHKRFRDGFAGTELDSLLQESGTTRLFVTGSQSDYCVQTTATSALAHGYDVALVRDAHTTCAANVDSGVIEAESVIDFVNNHFATMRYPGRHLEVISAADVNF
jgi:nicotinamidase-related amidase